jgi:hypothetical protein
VWPHSAWRASRIAEVDAELVRLGRGAGGLRLRLGEVLEALGAKGGVEALGFSSMGAYVVERCGLGASFMPSLRSGRGLACFPTLPRRGPPSRFALGPRRPYLPPCAGPRFAAASQAPSPRARLRLAGRVHP